jgi:putative sterol carrier protein
MSAGPPTSPEATAEWFRKHFRPEAARGLAAVIEVQLTGPGGGSICLQIEDGRITASLGGDRAPDARLAVAADDWRDVLLGRANGELLAMEGRIRIDGDLGLAMKMRSLFRRSA